MSLTIPTRHRPFARLAGRTAQGLLAASLALSLAVPLLPARAQTAAAPETAKAAPAGTAIFAELNTNLDSPQWQQAGALMARLGVPDALDQLRSEAVDMHGQQEMGQPPSADQLAALLGGEMAVAVAPDTISSFVEKALDAPLDENGQPMFEHHGRPYDMPGVAMIIAPSNMDVAWGYVEQQFAALATRNGTQVATVQQPGVVVLSVAAPEESAATPVASTNDGNGDGMMAAGSAAAKVGDLIVAATSADSLQPFLDAATGAAPNLGDSAEMQDVLSSLPTAEGLGFVYGDYAKVWDGFSAETKADMNQLLPVYANMGDKVWQAHGGGIVWTDTNGFRMDSIAVGGNGASLADLVPANGPIAGEQKVADDTALFVAGDAPKGTWDSTANSVAELVNMGMAEADSMMGTPAAVPQPPATLRELLRQQTSGDAEAKAAGSLGFNLKDDFFGQFGGPYTIALGLPAFGSTGLDFNAVFASDVGDAATVAASAEKIARLIGTLGSQDGGAATVSSRAIGSDKVYSVADTSGAGMPPVEFGVVGQSFAVGAGKGIDNFASGPSTALASNPRYQQTMALLPADKSQVVYVDLKSIVTLVNAFSGAGMAAMPDADASCAAFPDQAAAQAAFDADPMTNTALDQNFNGVVCEDFFAAATPEASPVPSGSIENLEAFGQVTYQKDGKIGSSAILVVSGS